QSCGRPLGFGAGTMWLSSPGAVTRVDLAAGAVVGSSLPFGGLTSVAFAGESVWGAKDGGRQILEIDPATNEVIREVPVGAMTIRVIFAYGALWVTDYGSSTVWRITLDQ
ncbi:MAG: YncE family protein, partial [Candidatus Limnocylindria bacterium]